MKPTKASSAPGLFSQFVINHRNQPIANFDENFALTSDDGWLLCIHCQLRVENKPTEQSRHLRDWHQIASNAKPTSGVNVDTAKQVPKQAKSQKVNSSKSQSGVKGTGRKKRQGKKQIPLRPKPHVDLQPDATSFNVIPSADGKQKVRTICRDCKRKQSVSVKEFGRAFIVRCIACGGALDSISNNNLR